MKFCMAEIQGFIGEAVKQEEMLCNDVETVREFRVLRWQDEFQ